MTRIFTASIAAAAALGLSIAATPAIAATLPDGDRVYILPCDDPEFNGLLYEVDTTSGVATQVGDWVNPDADVFDCAGPGAYNPVDGLGYWIAFASDTINLISVDLATGVNTFVAEFPLAGASDEVVALTINSAGDAWAVGTLSGVYTLFSVDLATAELTAIGPTVITPSARTTGLAWDPVTDAVYGYNRSDREFYTVNTDTGEFVLFAEDVLPIDFGSFTEAPIAIAFDSAGQVWGILQDIVSAPLSDLVNSEVLRVDNPLPVPSEFDIYSESIIIVPADSPEPAPEADAELAATGTADAGVASVGIVGLLLVMAGIVASRRRAARTA